MAGWTGGSQRGGCSSSQGWQSVVEQQVACTAAHKAAAAGLSAACTSERDAGSPCWQWNPPPTPPNPPPLVGWSAGAAACAALAAQSLSPRLACSAHTACRQPPPQGAARDGNSSKSVATPGNGAHTACLQAAAARRHRGRSAVCCACELNGSAGYPCAGLLLSSENCSLTCACAACKHR